MVSNYSCSVSQNTLFRNYCLQPSIIKRTITLRQQWKTHKQHLCNYAFNYRRSGLFLKGGPSHQPTNTPFHNNVIVVPGLFSCRPPGTTPIPKNNASLHLVTLSILSTYDIVHFMFSFIYILQQFQKY